MLPEHPTGRTGVRIVGAHTDSPALKLKPSAALSGCGYQLINAEVYGGPLLNSFLDRELGLAGRLVTRDGAVHLVRTGPIARVAQIAPHLDRSVNDTLHLDRQTHLLPLWSLAGPDAAPDAVGAPLRLDVITIFPDYLRALDLSLIGRAAGEGLIDLRVHDLRGWTRDRHRTVDDTPLGGGAGMVMKPDVWGEALDDVLAVDAPTRDNSRTRNATSERIAASKSAYSLPSA